MVNRKSESKKRSAAAIILILITGCSVMTFIDGVLSPNYAVKSLLKIILFLTLPIIYSLFDKNISFSNLFKFSKKGLLISILMGIMVYVFIIGSYFLLGPYFDLTNITTTLKNNIGVNENNFLFVALYISFINSLLEEFFFRGFAFLALKKLTGRKFSYIFSAGAFAVYHVAMMTSWFSIVLFALLIASLFIAGLLFDWINEKNDNIYASWMVHMCANFAINTVGCILFGII